MVTKNPTEVVPVQLAVMLITNEPVAGTTFLTVHVASAVRATTKTIELAVTVEFVTATEFAAAARFTVPAGLLMV